MFHFQNHLPKYSGGLKPQTPLKNEIYDPNHAIIFEKCSPCFYKKMFLSKATDNLVLSGSST